MTKAAKTAVMACMRNEGLFIVEWIAYHRVIGFDQVVICSNNCTDGSDALLDVLETTGAMIHLRHEAPTGDTPQDSGLSATFRTLAPTEIEWHVHIDADEFINIGLGEGCIADLLASAGMGDVIALPWWAFGDSGHTAWPGGVLSKFMLAKATPIEARVKFKSMFRFRKFLHANDHMPIRPLEASPDVRSSRGARLRDEGLHNKKRAKYRPLNLALQPEAACINHYAVPSRDVFLMKNDRGDGQGKSSGKYHLGSRWHEIANQNEQPNTSIQRHLNATQTEVARLKATPAIAHAEKHCIDWFKHRADTLLTPAQINTWSKPHARNSQ